MKELLFVKTNLPYIGRIKFDDDAFFLHSLEWMKDFAKQYKEKIKLILPSSLSFINEDLEETTNVINKEIKENLR